MRATDASRQLLVAWRDAERFQTMVVPEPQRRPADQARETRGPFDQTVNTWPPTPKSGPAGKAAHALITRVFVGCVPRALIDDRLRTMFTAENRFKQSPRASRSALSPVAYFDVDPEGLPIEDSLAICALTEFTFDLWRLTGGGPADGKSLQAALDNTDARVEQLTTTFSKRVAGDDETLTPLALTRALVEAMTAPTKHLLVWETAAGLRRAENRYHGIWVRSGQEREPDLLSSFFAADLERARSMSVYPPVLSAYLSAVGALGGQEAEAAGKAGSRHRQLARVDISERQSREPLLELDRLPRAAWPSGYPLRLSQQLAVTALLDRARTPEENVSALLSVNGPPGTGKTTLLRDLYANLVTQRAKVLATFDDPHQALSDPQVAYVRGDQREIPLHISALDPRLTGFEMVVTSSNNSAVENVSGALPGLDALAKERRPGARYFRTAAGVVATKWAERPDPNGRPRRRVEPWGLAAAILGRRSNINTFAEGLGLFEAKSVVGSGSLREALSAGATLAEWSEAVRAFRLASAAVEQAVLERQSACRRMRDRDRLRAEISDALTEVDKLRDNQSIVAEMAQQAEESAESAARASDAGDAAIHHLEAIRPSWWARWRRTTAAVRWIEANTEARLSGSAAAAACAEKQTLAAQAHEKMQQLTTQLDACSGRLDELQRQLPAAEQTAKSDQARYPALLTEEWWHRPQDEIELGSAWVDMEFQDLRETLFLTAMAIHETFSRVLGAPTLQALRVWKALTLGELRPEDRSKVAVRAWQWLFMIVPLVSTTLASLGRMLDDFDRPELGWVIIDEAGQATPQSAVGAMTRFQHAVVVGDPDQLEPVVTLPDELLDRITSHRAAAVLASPSRCSVQLLADAANPFGTMRNRRWVGLPLLVHNRCVDPMFALANRIAYQGEMVQGRLTDPDSLPAPLGPSRWLDVPLVGGSHWSEETAAAVRSLLEKLRPVASDPDQFVSIALLSPFRLVVENLRRLRDDFLRSLGLNPELAADEAQAAAALVLGPSWREASEAPNDRLTAGTVHTFQGRERDAVVLVLGGASDGARRWVANTPNLINVALTRARNRIYVVGDWNSWRVGHGATMQEGAWLPRHLD